MPKKPASLSGATLSQGYCSVRSISAARGLHDGRVAKSRARGLQGELFRSTARAYP